MSLSQGQVIHEKYRIAKRLGGSEFGAVYRAWDLQRNGPVALQEVITRDEGEIAQLEELSQRLMALQSAGLPKFLDAFTLTGQGFYIVSEFIEGEDLESLFEQTDGPLGVQQVLDWMLIACQSVEALHSQPPPIIHGNLKPSSLRIGEDGRLVVVGFGDIGVVDERYRSILGARGISPGYSPPEQYGKGVLNEASDVYALGATLYTLLGGKRLPESVLIKGRDVAPPKALREVNPLVSETLSQVVMQAISIDPRERFESVGAFRQALQAATQPVAETTAPQKRGFKWGWVFGGVFVFLILVGLLGFGGYYLYDRFLRESTPTPETVQLSPTLAPSATHTSAPTDTPTVTPQPSPTGLPSQIDDDFGVQMVLIPEGPFLMGSEYGAPDESPEHTVTLDAFYIDLYEVTNALYAVCVQAGACDPPLAVNSATRDPYYGNSEFADYPVINVSWFMAVDYCEWRGARLPTEAEWEKAARGDEGRIFPWGMEASCALANFWGETADCLGDTSQVGSYPEGISPFGLFDMAGNVWEWVIDWYDPGYYAVSPAENPSGPESGQHRVLRGGSWNGGVNHIRTTTRGRNLPDKGYNYVGFRCVRLP